MLKLMVVAVISVTYLDMYLLVASCFNSHASCAVFVNLA